MKKYLAIIFALCSIISAAAQDTAKTMLAALPITDYIISEDSVHIVQVQLPEGIIVAQKQLGLLKGIYRDGAADTGTLGWGRCQLIKADYYYFAIKSDQHNRLPRKGDLIYTNISQTNAYNGRIKKIALHNIGLQNVYGENLYTPLSVLLHCTKADENIYTDSLLADIQHTGKLMKEQMPSANIMITSGMYKDHPVLDYMQIAKKEDVETFLDYIIARPRLYAGNNWKMSEIFATWLTSGAPHLIK